MRPSSLLTIYLLLSALIDCAQMRTLFILNHPAFIADLFAICLGLKLVMLIVESQENTSCLKSEYKQLPPESKSGIINRSLLWWLNGLFGIGYRAPLTEDNLPELDPGLRAKVVGNQMQNAWERRSTLARASLDIVLIRCP